MRPKPPFYARPVSGRPGASGLVAAWICNEGGGGRLLDATGNRHDAVMSGLDSTPFWVSSPLGWTPSFDGVNDFGLFEVRNLPIGSQNRTILARYRTDNTDTGVDGNCIIGWGDTGAGLEFWATIEGDTTTIRVSSGNRIWTATGAADGNWHDVAWVLDGTATDDLVAYLDGSLLAVDDTLSRTINTLQTQGTIGARPSNTAEFQMMDEIAYISVYDHAKGGDEIRSIQAAPFTMLRPDLIWLLKPADVGRLLIYPGMDGGMDYLSAGGMTD